jgi:TetR/AcrR family transcriptional repressor of nem operon
MAAVGCGCPIAALGADTAREKVEAQQAFAHGLKDVLHAAVTSLGDRAEAIAALATLVGAMVMARAVNGADPDLASEILKAPVAHMGPKALHARGRRKERRV